MSKEDTQNSIGKLLEGEHERDAIHIAVAPVYALDKVWPGQHVGLVDGDIVSTQAATMIGIVDPFLRNPVFPHQPFWLFLYPNTITSLKHQWTHPVFDKAGSHVSDAAKKLVQAATDEMLAASETWLRDFCKVHDCPGYETVLKALKGESLAEEGGDPDYPTSAYIGEYFHFNGRDAHDSIPPEFWDHAEIVTGRKFTHRPEYFSCSC